MHAVYLACLIGGAVATALFALLGLHGSTAHSGHAHLPHGHAGHHHLPVKGHSGAHSHAAAGSHGGWKQALSGSAGWVVSWLSPLTISAAALWFGGIGLLSESSAFAWLFAVIAALLGAALIHYLMGAFVRASTPPLALGADGAMATVNATIRPGAPGEVIYTLEGLHRSLPARSEDGQTIPRGTAVVITRREGGFAWVEPIEPLDVLSGEEQIDATR